jgi:hypothetical protein
MTAESHENEGHDRRCKSARRLPSEPKETEREQREHGENVGMGPPLERDDPVGKHPNAGPEDRRDFTGFDLTEKRKVQRAARKRVKEHENVQAVASGRRNPIQTFG